MAQSYYKVIDGERYDREMLDIAEESVAGKGDGRISVDDAKKLFEAIIDGNTVTEIEEKTLAYIRENFKFTDAADEWLMSELEAWKENAEVVESPKPADSKGSPFSTPKKKLRPKTKVVYVTKPQRKTKQETGAGAAGTSETTPVYWKLLVLILVLLIGVAYFFGRSSAPEKDNPVQQEKIDRLESELEMSSQELARKETEVDVLKEQLSEMSEEPEPPTVQIQEKIVRVEDESIENRNRVRSTLEEKLAMQFNEPFVEFNSEDLVISLIPSQPYFAGGYATPTRSLKQALDAFFPELVEALVASDGEISEIRFRGHTSSIWRDAGNQTEAYLKNMGLSSKRAEAAIQYCLGMKGVQQHQAWLKKRLVSVGLSNKYPVLNEKNEEDPVLSRRITIAIETPVNP